MSYYDDIFEIAAENHGVVTSAAAYSAGIPRMKLVKLANSDMLEHIGYGVYRFGKWISSEWDVYAEAVALVGDGAMVWGESVLAMHGLALVLPDAITIACPRRVRRALPDGIRLVRSSDGTLIDYADGIPTQCVADAIRTCRTSIMPERLIDAVSDAKRQGLITQIEAEELLEELSCQE